MNKPVMKIAFLTMALSLTASVVPQAASAASYRVVVNGNPVSGAQAEMVNGTLAVSIRPVMEALGAQVTWSGANQEVGVGYGGSWVAMWIGSRTAFQDGTRLQAPVAPFLENGRTMAPGWWLAQRFNTKVSFDGTTLFVTTPVSGSGEGSAPLWDPSFFFPYTRSAHYDTYYDTWGDNRYFQGNTTHHEGTDILAPKDTPIVAVASGTVLKYGWNTLGGYRLLVQLDSQPGYRFYYAHLDKYAAGMHVGAHVTAGQVIGYVGNTGEGPERTEGKFVTHLHFGIYGPDDKAIDPYPFLKFWESHKVQW